MVSKYLKTTLIVVAIIALIVPVFYFSFYNRNRGETVIEVWYTYEGFDVVQSRVQEYENLNPDIKINLQEQPASGWLDKFISVAQTGESPDVFLAKGAWFGELAELEYIRPLTTFLSPQEEAKFLPEAINGLSYKNELWGLPLWSDSILLFYNKDLFNQNSLDYPTSNWTEVELIDAALSITDRSANQIYGLAWATISPYMWPAFQYGFGHGPLYQSGDIIVNDTSSVDAMEFIYNLKYVQRCVNYDDSSSAATQAFVNNKAGMLIYGGWYIPTLEDLDFNYGIEILPKISSTNERISPMLEIKGWGISKDTEYPDISYDISSFLASKETQELLILEESKVSTLNVDNLNASLINHLTETQIEQLTESQYYPLDPIYNAYSDYMRAALQFILIDHMDIQTILNEAQVGIDANKRKE
jgi:multiple sugar transport system substrate-binding protein